MKTTFLLKLLLIIWLLSKCHEAYAIFLQYYMERLVVYLLVLLKETFVLDSLLVQTMYRSKSKQLNLLKKLR